VGTLFDRTVCSEPLQSAGDSSFGPASWVARPFSHVRPLSLRVSLTPRDRVQSAATRRDVGQGVARRKSLRTRAYRPMTPSTENPGVGGSIPSLPTILLRI